jgi:hypothetical protein
MERRGLNNIGAKFIRRIRFDANGITQRACAIAASASQTSKINSMPMEWPGLRRVALP